MSYRNNEKFNSESDVISVSTIMLTHANRIFKTTDTVTKKILADYYDNVSDLMLPYIVNRPLVLFRCPDDTKTKCFFQKHYNKSFSKYIYPIKISDKTTISDYLKITSKKGLISLVQFSVLEIHAWGSNCKNIEKPDCITFDLDPAPDVNWKAVVKTAVLLREILQQLNLISYLKTSGGKGLHIVVPIARYSSWTEVKHFSHTLASYLTQAYPDKYTDNPLILKRTGKIFIDYLRNAKGATTVAPYSMRSKKNGPISTPISWEELPSIKSSNQYNVLNIMKRLSKLSADPWEGFFQCRQRLPKTTGWE